MGVRPGQIVQGPRWPEPVEVKLVEELGESGVLQDSQRPYVERRAGRDITAELRNSLRQRRRVLVTSISGVGKTRGIGCWACARPTAASVQVPSPRLSIVRSRRTNLA